MSLPSTDLAVRGSARYQCSLEAVVAIGHEHARFIRPDKSAPGAGGPVSVTIVDLSLGGVGLTTPLFLPRLCRLTVTLTPPGRTDPIAIELRVHRVTMLDRVPTYYIGAAFDNVTPEQTEAILGLFNHLKANGATLVPELPRA